MRTNHLRWLPAFTLAIVITGCVGWRAPRQPDPRMPESYSLDRETGELNDQAWWPALGDPNLDQILSIAFTDNLTLAQAVGRLDQVLAGYRISRASFYPDISAQLSIADNGEFGDETEATGLPGGFAVPTTPRHTAALSAVYDLDLWGKNQAGRQAAEADLLAGGANLQALVLTLSAQITRTYYRLIELKHQDELLRYTIESYKDSSALVRARYRRGVAISLDVYQAETTLAAARARHALIKGELAKTRNALAVLLGRFPGAEILPPGASLPLVVPPVPTGLPSDLLERRPDVRAAYWNLLAADRRVAEAVASRFPSLSLTGSISGSDDDLIEAVKPDNLIWNAIGSLFTPIIDAGKRKANVETNEAAWRIQGAAFQETLLNAVREVEDALVMLHQQQEYLSELAQQVEAADSSLRLANDRYLQGIADYLPVVVAQTSSYTARSQQIAARRGLVDTYVALVTALGGGWTDAIIHNYQNRALFKSDRTTESKG